MKFRSPFTVGRRAIAYGLVISALAALHSTAGAAILSGDNAEASPVWQKVRASLFKNRPIAAAPDDLLTLDAPDRAYDAAIVPIAIKTGLQVDNARRIDKLYLIIDNNPSPISAEFQFTPLSGRADIETRVRIDEYTHVRAIAETDDGKLYMATRFVKAAGGCSAPPGKDQQAALATLGKMKFRIEPPQKTGAPALAQLMISHPNNSGLAMDQLSRLYTPSHFVREVRITYGGKLVMSADVDFSISENPNFRFYFLPQGDGELKAEVVDSHDLHFTTALKYHSPE